MFRTMSSIAYSWTALGEIPLKSEEYFKGELLKSLPDILLPVWIPRHPWRSEKDVRMQGLFGCGTVSKERNTCVVRKVILWKKDTNLHIPSSGEEKGFKVSCVRGSFLQADAVFKVSSFGKSPSGDNEVSGRGQDPGFIIFSRKLLAWSNLTKLKFTFSGLDISTLTSTVKIRQTQFY